MKPPANRTLVTLQEELGYRFENPALLERALTHRSRAAEHPAASADNERLEFLGDSVLGLLVCEALLVQFPDFTEGQLSKMRAWLVSANYLFGVAEQLRLGEMLILGRGEEMSGGRGKRALLADAVEALLGAIYLDGGLEPAREVVRNFILRNADSVDLAAQPGLADFKSALQERAQALKLPQPRYTIVSERGPEHAKTFEVEARVGKEYCAKAEGVSKKEAGQRAAERLLLVLSNDGSPTPQ